MFSIAQLATTSTVRDHARDLAKLGTPRHAGVRLHRATWRRSR